MKPNEKDWSILAHIVEYCDQIDATIERFGKSYTRFAEDIVYRNATALCILQIGELTGKLSEEFKDHHTDVPWKQIRAMRNIVAHAYGTVDTDITWEVISEDIPKLKQYCEVVLRTCD